MTKARSIVFGLLGSLTAGCADSSVPAEDGIVASEGYVIVSADAEQVALYATLRNAGAAPDSLVSIDTAISGRASLHEVTTVDGLMQMGEVTALPLPPGQAVRLEPGALHGMLEELTSLPEDGTTLPVTFSFAKSPPIVLEVEVRSLFEP